MQKLSASRCDLSDSVNRSSAATCLPSGDVSGERELILFSLYFLRL